jgi:glycosyltransferase involved in cell wall biosynthesis
MIKNNPRLLIILNRFVIGGQASDTLSLAYYLKPNFEILILYGEKEKDEIETLFLLDKYPGLTVKKIKQLRRTINPVVDLLALITLLIIVRKFKPDIVHTHGAKTGILGRITAFFCNVPVIVHTFHGHFFHSYFSSFVSSLVAAVERLMAKITTAVVALSEDQKQDLVEVYKVTPPEKVHIIPLGFDLFPQTDLSRFRKSFRDKYGIDNNVIAIGIVGRIVPVKNHQLFLKVADKILNEKPQHPLAFFIVGDGELKASLQQNLKEKGINYSTDKYSDQKKIVFTSWVTSMEEVMNGLDIIVLTSLNEGTPLTLIEAQYFRKPVIATNVGGVKDTMEDGKTGFLVEPGNASAFADKLMALVNDPLLRETFGAAGKKLVEHRFFKRNEVSLTQKLYFSLLRKKNIDRFNN